MKILKKLGLLVVVFMALSYVNFWGAYVGEFSLPNLLIVIGAFVMLKRVFRAFKNAVRAYRAQVKG